jgi:glycosyltransferase involved in cell wall biosynthesis
VKPVLLEISSLLSPRPTGIGTFGRRLVEALARRAAFPYGLVYPCGRMLRLRHTRGLDMPLSGYLDGRALGRRSSLLHALDTRLPPAYRGILVATIFDLLSALPLSERAGLSSAGFRRRKLRAYAQVAARAQRVVTLSDAVRQSVLDELPVRCPVVVIPPGTDFTAHGESPGAGEGRGAGEEERPQPPYLLVVGALCPRKNIEAIVRAFQAARRSRPALRLLLVGEPSWGWTGSRGEDALRRCGASAVLAGYLPQRALRAAYSGAAALLYLSHYEGFGLPVLEALACGTPVVASRRGGIPEAGGDAAWLVDPDRDEEVDAALEEALGGGSEVVRRRRRGLEHAAGFSWERTAERTEALYRTVVED